MRKRWILVAGLLTAPGAWAQVPSDAQAYFQWMLAVTDDTLTPRMAAHLSTAGLNGDEAVKAARILSDFKAKEFGLEESYNNLPSVQEGRNDGTESFYLKQQLLVVNTVAKLGQALSTESFSKLDARIQHEKGNIRVASAPHKHDSMLMPVSFGGRPQRLGMTPNYTYYNTSASGFVIYPVTPSMLTDTNCQPFPQWNAANLVDGDPSTVGFSTDTSQAWQSCVSIDFGAPQDIVEIGMYLSATNYNGQFAIYYSDDKVNWVYTSPGADYFAPSNAGWNYFGWVDAGSHRYWQVSMANTPGAGPTINELQLIRPGSIHYTTSQVTGTTSCPDGCPPLAKHVGWAQVVVASTVHNTFGPQVYPTSYINVSDSESTVLPVGGPPVNVSTTGGVNCTVAGNGFSGTPSINNDIIFATTYSENLNIGCGTIGGLKCTEIIDYCTPDSVPPDYDPTQAVGTQPIISAPFFIGHADCDRPHGSPIGTHWECLTPTPPGYTLPRGTPVRRTCTNTDKGTKGDWPGPW